MLTISATPASRARTMTASMSSANCGACRLTWLSMSMGSGRPRRRAQLAHGGPEGVCAVQIQAFGLVGQLHQPLPGLRPAIEALPLPGHGLVGGHDADLVGDAFDQQVEPPLPFRSA